VEGLVIVRIDHVQLAIPPGADAEAKARAFYIELLGLHEVPKPEAMRARGGMWFAEGVHLGLESNVQPSAKAHVALIALDLAALEVALAAAGLPFVEARDQPGVRRGHTHDPFGNRIELIAV
jgi:catechol 2,3-dioxygenase-like lactoylglutathione lyase family enzyme